MYIDESIIIDENLPKSLQNDINELEHYYKTGEWLEYDLLLEVFEPSVKQYCYNGRITMETGYKLLEKYN